MRQEIKQGIKIVKNASKIPEGYELKKSGIYPIDWQEKQVHEICDSVDYRGKTPVKTEKGVFLLTARNIKDGEVDYEISQEYVSYSDYEEVMRRGIPKLGDVVITTEAPLGNVAQIDNEKVAIAQRVIKLRADKKILINDYLKYFLLSDKFQSELYKQSTGSTVKGIKGARFKKLEIVYPQLAEQEKIISILYTWDKAIKLKQRLIDLKRLQKNWLMKVLLTGKLRLHGFMEEWKEVKLEDLFDRITRKNSEGNVNVLTISAQRGLINQEDFFNKSVASDILDNYYLLQKGEFAYNKSYSNGYPMGAIKRLNLYDSGVVTTLYICFGLKEDYEKSSDYFEQYFESGLLNEALTKIAQEGGRAHGLLNVSPKDFFNMTITIPDDNERIEISLILNASSKEIKLLEEELAELKQQKKGLMQLLLTGIVRVKY